MGGKVRPFGLSGQARKVFGMSALDELFWVTDTREQAMEGWEDAKT